MNPLLLFANGDQTQKNNDQYTYEYLYNAFDSLIYSMPDSALVLAHTHYDKANRENNKPEMLKALDSKSFAFSVLEQLDSAIVQIHRAIDLSMELGNDERLHRLYNNLGYIHYYQEDYLNAFKNYNKALQ